MESKPTNTIQNQSRRDFFIKIALAGLATTIPPLVLNSCKEKIKYQGMAGGRFVTRGILFDINSTTLKPESMGVNRVAKMMQQHSNLNFTIEGHTDGDDKAAANLKLSTRRANAAKIALIEFGIDKSRLQTEGKGESVPVSNNK